MCLPYYLSYVQKTFLRGLIININLGYECVLYTVLSKTLIFCLGIVSDLVQAQEKI